MKQLYELLEDVRNIIAEKFISGYSLASTYRAVMYAFIYAAIQRTRNNYELLKPLEQRTPLPLLAAAKRELVSVLHDLLEYMDSLLTSERPVIVEGEASLRHIIEVIRYEVGNVDYVLVYDCMSVIEQLVISAFLKVRGVRSMFLSKVFLNPIGLTRFTTQQLYGTGYRATLLGLAQYVANRLNASLYRKNPYIDEKVHEVGLLGIDEFVDKISIDKIAHEVLEKACRGRTLVFSDHGYDLIVSPGGDYLYVTHGFKQPSTLGSTPLLLLSRITLFMGAYRVG
jgi:hypothetical protein